MENVRFPRYVAALLLCAAGSAVTLADTPVHAQASASKPRVYRTIENRIAIGRSITVAADEEVTDAVVVIGGSVRVDGRVRHDLVVVGGNADLGPQAVVRGDVVVVGGRLTRAPGSQLRGSVSD